MKYFVKGYEDHNSKEGILSLTEQATNLIIQICRNLRISLQSMHLALWIFHCQAKIITYQKFDRFVYLCAAILIGTKIGECLRNPIDIVHQLRIILRKRKSLPGQDSQQTKTRLVKKVFQAQVNMMINIGFDLDIQVAIQSVQGLKQQINDSDLIQKVKQTLTSLYKTETVVYYQPKQLLYTALKIVLKNQGISIALSGYPPQLIEQLNSEKVKQIKLYFLQKCTSK